jgi:hypothetical protein
VVTTGDTYWNERLRLTVCRPRGWDFSSVADFAALRERQVLPDVLVNEPHPLRDPQNLPVFIFENTSARDGVFAPAIALYDETLEGSAPLDQQRSHREVMLDGFALSYKEMQVLREPELVRVRGAEGTLSQWSYVHEIDDGTERQLIVRSLFVFRESRVHTFHMVDSPTSRRVPESAWSEFIATIHYAG